MDLKCFCNSFRSLLIREWGPLSNYWFSTYFIISFAVFGCSGNQQITDLMKTGIGFYLNGSRKELIKKPITIPPKLNKRENVKHHQFFCTMLSGLAFNVRFSIFVQIPMTLKEALPFTLHLPNHKCHLRTLLKS